MGNREAALINVSMAMDLLEQSLPAIGSESAEGKQILSAIRSMIGVLGVKKASTAELQPAEILQMLQSLPQAGGASPESKAMMSAPAIPGMAPEGPAPVLPMPPPTGGGGLPPGAPVPPPI